MIITPYITDAIIEECEHPQTRIMTGSGHIIEDKLASPPLFQSGTASGRYEPGGCIASSMTVQIYDYNGEEAPFFTNGTELRLQVKYRTQTEWTTIGSVNINDQSTDGKVITLTCYDRLKDGDKITYNGQFPATINQIMQTAAGQLNIQVSQLPPAGGSITIDPEQTPSMTVRQALLYAAQAAGCFIRIDENGALSAGWYNLSDIRKTYKDAFGGEFAPTHIYTGVQVAGEIQGNEGYIYTLDGNPFITENNAAQIRQRLYDALVGVPVPSVSISVLTDPRLQPGDTVKVPCFGGSGQVLVYTMPITSISFRGTMRETISCETGTADQLQDKRTASAHEQTEQILKDAKTYTDQQIAGMGGDYIETEDGHGQRTTIENGHLTGTFTAEPGAEGKRNMILPLDWTIAVDLGKRKGGSQDAHYFAKPLYVQRAIYQTGEASLPEITETDLGLPVVLQEYGTSELYAYQWESRQTAEGATIYSVGRVLEMTHGFTPYAAQTSIRHYGGDDWTFADEAWVEDPIWTTHTLIDNTDGHLTAYKATWLVCVRVVSTKPQNNICIECLIYGSQDMIVTE